MAETEKNETNSSVEESFGVMKYWPLVKNIGIAAIWPIIIPFGLFLYTDWEPMHQWYGFCYLALYAYSAVAIIHASGNWAFVFGTATYFCAKFTGILLLCWLRWGYQVWWMSGDFGLGLIIFFSIGYILGRIFYLPWAEPLSRLIINVFKWIQDAVMRTALNFKFLYTYYNPPNSFLKRMEKKYRCQGMLLTNGEGVSGLQNVETIASSRIYHHAIVAAVVTFLCALPQGWISWPLLIVDTIIYQRQIFRVSQEMAMLYWPTSRPDFPKFDYMTLANIVMKIEGNFIGRQSKSAVGWVVNWLAKKIPVITYGPLLYFLGHVTKWFGVVISRELVSHGLEYLTITICGLIAAAITFWIFFPAAKRCKSYFEYGDPTSDSTCM